MASKKKVTKPEAEALDVVEVEPKEEAHPIRDMVNKIFPPRPDSTETAIIRDLVKLVNAVVPTGNYSAVIRAEKYLEDKGG